MFDGNVFESLNFCKWKNFDIDLLNQIDANMPNYDMIRVKNNKHKSQNISAQNHEVV